MINLFRKVLRGEHGIGMVITIGFMALCVPILTAGLGLAGTLSNDSQVKTRLAKSQYASIGALEYVRYLAADPETWDDWLES